MIPGPWNWLILLAVLLVPFQRVGITVCYRSRSADPGRARTRGLFVLAGVFVAGSFLNLAVSAVVMSILARKKPA